VDGAAEEQPGLLRRQVEQPCDQRVDHHRQCRQCSDRDDGEQGKSLAVLLARQHRRDGQRRRGAADRHRTAAQDALAARQAQATAERMADEDRAGHRRDDDQRRAPAQAGDLHRGDARAEPAATAGSRSRAARWPRC
jgi:hypothetical protein